MIRIQLSKEQQFAIIKGYAFNLIALIPRNIDAAHSRNKNIRSISFFFVICSYSIGNNRQTRKNAPIYPNIGILLFIYKR